MDTELREKLIRAGKCIACIKRDAAPHSLYCKHHNMEIAYANSRQNRFTYQDLKRANRSEKG